MILRAGLWAAGLGAALAASVITAAVADEEPKRGGALTYMIPADGPPSFDGHREATYATVHSAAPYYSVLIRVNPDNSVDFDRHRVRSSRHAASQNRPRRHSAARPFPFRRAPGLVHAEDVTAKAIEEGRDPSVGDAVHVHLDIL